MLKRLLFHNFRAVYRFDTWIRRHFTPAGMLILGGMVAAAVFGIDTRQTLAYQLFSLFFMLLLLAMLSSWSFRWQGQFRRHLPQFATIGEALRYKITLENASPHFQQGLLIRDELALNLPDYVAFDSARRADGMRRNWFDDYVGYPRWLALLQQRRGGFVKEKLLPPMPAHSSLDVHVELIPVRRGYLQFGSLCVARSDPLGLFKALRYIPCTDRLLVLPKRYPVPDIHLPGRRKYQPGGVQLASSTGDAVEFVSLREYRPGDPLRHIHWKSFARQNKPVVKEYEDEFFVRHALVLDTFIGQQPIEYFEEAVSVASSFVCRLVDKESLLDFMFVGNQAYCVTAGRGLQHIDNLLEILACVEPCRNSPFSELSPLIRSHSAALSSCLCIFIDWDREREQLIENLQSQGLPTLALVIHAEKPDTDNPAVQHLRPEQMEADLLQLAQRNIG